MVKTCFVLSSVFLSLLVASVGDAEPWSSKIVCVDDWTACTKVYYSGH